MNRFVARRVAAASVLALAVGGFAAITLPATAAQAPVMAVAVDPDVAAARVADAYVSGSGRAALHRSTGDALTRTGVRPGGNNLRYVTYDRTYRGLAVVGGDAVVVTDGNGVVLSTSVAQEAPITVESTTPTLTPADAAGVARSGLDSVTSVTTPALVVLAWVTPARLAWDVTVEANSAVGPTRQRRLVDAHTGAILATEDLGDRELAADGVGWYSGLVNIEVQPLAGGFRMEDPTRPGQSCADLEGVIKTKGFGGSYPWGGQGPLDPETVCVDAMYGASMFWNMLRDWLGRNGINGQGAGNQIRVLRDETYIDQDGAVQPMPVAAWSGDGSVYLGRRGGRAFSSLDVMGHELGHAVSTYSPNQSVGTDEQKGIEESVADIFGMLVEWYANHIIDRPDYEIAEMPDPFHQYVWRALYAGGCYTQGVGSGALEVMDHWFYLTAEGSQPTNGQPNSPTCVPMPGFRGIGPRTAGVIFYNALQMRTTNWTLVDVRQATLNAARNLYPNDCAPFDAVQRAWNGVGVPTIGPGDPICGDFSLSVAPGSATVQAGQSVTVQMTTTVTSGSPRTLTMTSEGAPPGGFALFTPSVLLAGDRPFVTFNTQSFTPPGYYLIRLRATASNQSKTVSFGLTVTAAPTPAPPLPSCTATIVAGQVWSDRFNLSVNVSGTNNWIVTVTVTPPQKIIATWSGSPTWDVSGNVMTMRPNGSGNTFGFTTRHNGNWTWPTVSCRVGP